MRLPGEEDDRLLGPDRAIDLATFSTDGEEHTSFLVMAGLGMDAFRFQQPVRVGDTLHAEVKVLEKKETRDPSRGVITFGIAVLNQGSEVALDYRATVLVRRR